MDLDAWIAAMPVEAVRNRIAQLEGELGFLRELERQRRDQPAPEITSARLADRRSSRPQPSGRGGRLTPERRSIIEAIRTLGRPAPPREVAEAVRGTGQQVEDNAVQTNLSRMAKYGMVVRLGSGLYDLPPEETTAESNGTGSAGSYERVIEP